MAKTRSRSREVVDVPKIASQLLFRIEQITRFKPQFDLSSDIKGEINYEAQVPPEALGCFGFAVEWAKIGLKFYNPYSVDVSLAYRHSDICGGGSNAISFHLTCINNDDFECVKIVKLHEWATRNEIKRYWEAGYLRSKTKGE